MSRAERWLIILLRLSGAACALAILAVFMPTAWIDAGHRAMGLGPLPAEPIVPYLARSLSAFYALLGGFWWMAAGDLRRYDKLIAYSAVASLIAGPLLLWMDISLGLPAMWIVGEGPVVFLHGAAILALLVAARRAVSEELVRDHSKNA